MQMQASSQRNRSSDIIGRENQVLIVSANCTREECISNFIEMRVILFEITLS